MSNTSNGQIVEVWESVEEDISRLHRTGRYYQTYEAAKADCNGIGGVPEPRSRKGLLLLDGRVWLLVEEDPRHICKNLDDYKRQKALEKLTPEERKLLKL